MLFYMFKQTTKRPLRIEIVMEKRHNLDLDEQTIRIVEESARREGVTPDRFIEKSVVNFLLYAEKTGAFHITKEEHDCLVKYQ